MKSDEFLNKMMGERLTDTMKKRFPGKDFLKKFMTVLEQDDYFKDKKVPTAQTIINIRNGKTGLTREKAVVFARVLGTTPNYLLCLPEPQQPPEAYNEPIQSKMRLDLDAMKAQKKESIMRAIGIMGAWGYSCVFHLVDGARNNYVSKKTAAGYIISTENEEYTVSQSDFEDFLTRSGINLVSGNKHFKLSGVSLIFMGSRPKKPISLTADDFYHLVLDLEYCLTSRFDYWANTCHYKCTDDDESKLIRWTEGDDVKWLDRLPFVEALPKYTF